jgi:hypothetical protein
MTSSNGSSERMVVVRIADQVNQALIGHPGCRYQSPPQDQEQARALIELLVGYAPGALDGNRKWSCPIAGGRRTITLVPLD